MAHARHMERYLVRKPFCCDSGLNQPQVRLTHRTSWRRRGTGIQPSHPKVMAWLGSPPALRPSTSPRPPASWLNAVEGFFAKLTNRRLKRGVFRSLVDLQAAINRFLDEHNEDPKPFVWTADPDKIIAAVRRGHQVLDSIH